MAHFACRKCGRSWRPREKPLDIKGSITLSARRLASVAGSETDYAKADELLRELSELNFGAKRVERTTRAAGADFEAWRAASGAEAPPRRRLKPGWTLCRALDGTGVPMSPRETAGRAGKDGDAPPRTREAKADALWMSERDARGRPRAVAGTTVLFAAVESAADVPRRRHRVDSAAVRRVEECRRAARYLAERRDRTRYGELRATGLPIGSGRVEAGCKNIVDRRMKGAGIRWSVDGANPVLWLRCARQSGSFDDYWQARLDRLAA